jgi:hypothetical protein
MGGRLPARLHQVGGIIDHGREIALAGATEVPIGLVFDVAGFIGRTEIGWPETAGSGFRGDSRIVEFDGSHRDAILRPIGAHGDGMKRESRSGKDRPHFAHRLLGG